MRVQVPSSTPSPRGAARRARFPAKEEVAGSNPAEDARTHAARSSHHRKQHCAAPTGLVQWNGRPAPTRQTRVRLLQPVRISKTPPATRPVRAASSTGQSIRLLIGGFQVRVLGGALRSSGMEPRGPHKPEMPFESASATMACSSIRQSSALLRRRLQVRILSGQQSFLEASPGQGWHIGCQSCPDGPCRIART